MNEPGRGDVAGALQQLSRIRLPFVARTAAASGIDTAVRAGEQDLARRWVDELTGYAIGTRRPWALTPTELKIARLTT